MIIASSSLQTGFSDWGARWEAEPKESDCILQDVLVTRSLWKLIFASAYFRSVWKYAQM